MAQSTKQGKGAYRQGGAASSKVDVLGRGAPGKGTDAHGRVTAVTTKKRSD
jgi:hypothetical protein